MTPHPPFALKRQCFYWLEHLIDHYRDGNALRPNVRAKAATTAAQEYENGTK